MSKNDRTLDKIMEAFAESVAAGDIEKAEGWLAVAAWSQGISEKAIPAPVLLKKPSRSRMYPKT